MNMSSSVDNSSDLTTDAEPLKACNIESLKISSDEEKKEPPPKPKERRKSSSSRPRDRPRRPDSLGSNVMMNFVNSQDIHIGNNYTVIGNPNIAPDFMRSTSALKKTQEIKDLFAAKDVISKEEIVFLSTHVGRGWRKVGFYLDYSEGQLDHFDVDHGNKSGMGEAIFQMLLDWKNSRTEEEATVGIVAKAMWKAKERDAVQRWAYRRGKPVPPSSA